MSTLNHIIKGFDSATHNRLDDEGIPSDAAQASENWITVDGRIEIARGREFVGAEGIAGRNDGVHFGYTNSGTEVLYQKVGTEIQYFNPTTLAWVSVVTGLTDEVDYTFSNYSSLAGSFVIATGPDGIYKFHTTNPTNYIALYDSTKNFKGYSFIDKGRMIMWGVTKDKTGLYGSKIDAQDSTVYTTVTGEATTSLSGTLAFKAGGATRNCFGVVITVGAETFTDDYNGVLVGSAGGTGTINYITGAYTVSVAGAGTATYQWENSNVKGITDFTKSATRIAGEGFILRQDVGGDAIQTVLIGQDGAYYSLKKNSCYRLELDLEDINPRNEVFRTDIGVPSNRAAVATGSGIVFIDTANSDRPKLKILQRNPLGDTIEPQELCAHYDFSLYDYDDAAMVTWGRYVVLACREKDSTKNNVILLIDISAQKVDKTTYPARTFGKTRTGSLYAGSPYTRSTQKLFVDFDDDGAVLENFWTGRGETYDQEDLKKFKKIVLQGLIDPAQYYEVYISTDNDAMEFVGTVRGDGSYVDTNSPYQIGSSAIGDIEIGGATAYGDYTAYPYRREIPVRMTKFRKMTVQFVAKGIGYCSIDTVMHNNILRFEQRIPKKFRVKQHENLAGTENDIARAV